MRVFASLLALAGILLLLGCGKTPEQVGQQPRQTLDKVQSDVDQAMKKETGHLRDAEKKD